MIKKWIYNPFEYIAGVKALLIGLAVMFLSTFIGTLNGSHFDGAIDIHIGARTPVSLFYVETFISWFVTSLIFYLNGLILSKSSVRISDVFGTMAFARIPLLIAVLVGFFPVLQQVGNLNPSNTQEAVQKIISVLPLLMLVSAPLIAAIIWSITLMYNAYKVSCNLKGTSLTVSFIVALIVSEIATKAAIYGVYRHMYHLPLPIPGTN